MDEVSSPGGAEFAGSTGGAEIDAKEILAFERQWWQHAGTKEAAIRERFSLSPIGYYQKLNALLDDPGALAADPVLVKRLRRIRSGRQKARAARRLEFSDLKHRAWDSV